jgi:phosphoribosylformylglycinamidine (FGAM) synthase-like enzyme
MFIAEMCIGGNIGAEIDINNISKGLRADFKLFSESNTRWVVEVKKEKQKDFEKTLKENKTPYIKIGETKGKNLVIKDNGKVLINLKIDEIRKIWKNAIWDIMG